MDESRTNLVGRGRSSRRRLTLLCLAVGVLMGLVTRPVPSLEERSDQSHVQYTVSEHPRLYFSQGELENLRALRTQGFHASIWRNLAESADSYLDHPAREDWIAPVENDPIYENLYDRFYAMMMDMAITEHLAFAFALSGDERYGGATREWVLACCRSWKEDADAKPDGGKAYAVSRLVKGIAVSYDIIFDQLAESERLEIRSMLHQTAANYFREYFSRADKTGPGFHTHHAIVEYSSFGVVALVLLGEVPEAAEWLEKVTKKFEDHLLPTGLAPDGAQTEGATFWASTMQYRLFFMDALRRVTGRDLFSEYEDSMNANLALASIATEKHPGWNESHQTVVLSPPYGQLDYYAPVLLGLAREYRRPIHQHLALWDHSLGQIQKTRYITPNRREQLMFELGGYAYIWYDPTVPSEPIEAPLSYSFPSVGQAYARGSWEPNGLLVGLNKGGQTVIHAGGIPVLSSSSFEVNDQPAELQSDDGQVATLRCCTAQGPSLSVRMKRPNLLSVEWRMFETTLSFRSHRLPKVVGNSLVWENRAELRITTGQLRGVEPEGYRPEHAVGNGKLKLIDPMPKSCPVIHIDPCDDGIVGVEISLLSNS